VSESLVADLVLSGASPLGRMLILSPGATLKTRLRAVDIGLARLEDILMNWPVVRLTTETPRSSTPSLRLYCIRRSDMHSLDRVPELQQQLMPVIEPDIIHSSPTSSRARGQNQNLFSFPS